MTFEEMVRKIRVAVGSRSRIVHVPVSVAQLAAGAIGVAVRDVLITDHELGGLMAELATTDGPTTGRTRFSDWIADAGRSLPQYASEAVRHFASP
jgi:NADH dehydrogenase